MSTRGDWDDRRDREDDRTRELIHRLEKMQDYISHLSDRCQQQEEDLKMLQSMITPVMEDLTDEQAISLLTADVAIHKFLPKNIQERQMVKDYMLYVSKL